MLLQFPMSQRAACICEHCGDVMLLLELWLTVSTGQVFTEYFLPVCWQEKRETSTLLWLCFCDSHGLNVGSVQEECESPPATTPSVSHVYTVHNDDGTLFVNTFVEAAHVWMDFLKR